LSEMALDHENHFISSAGLSAGERLGEGLRLLQRLAPAGALLLRDTATLTHSGWSDGVRAAAGRQSSFRLGADALLPAGLWLSGEAIANAPAPDGALHAGALAWADWAQRLSLAAAAAGDLLAGAVQAPPSTAAITLPDRARAIAAPPAPPIKASPPTINGFFERVVVLNLDRRPDRWESMQRKLQRAGITAERFAAIDGQTPDIAADYAAYAAGALAPAPENARPISASRAFYLDYDSQAARVAFIEATAQRKAIASAGAWGYLKSMEAVLEQALADQVSSLLVLDDDVLFHRDARTLFADAVKELPADWLILQLGTLQYHWTNDWLHWRTERLYQTNGSAIGSHAVGMRFDIIPFLLEQIKKMELPYDTGALSAATGAFKDRCFVTYPNIAIQQLVDTDIGTSDFQASAGRTNAAETYRWSLSDYEE
ncbi:MAG: glycosyltransferase family 25 protein, partial [Hyphomonadaceae bacterium]